MTPRAREEPRPPVQAVLVVVPARDEEAEIAGALEALADTAADAPLPVAVAVVLHRCTDGTADRVAEVVARRPETAWMVVPSEAATLGGARAEGVDAGRERLSGHDPAQVWLASTDADTRVPTTWVRHHSAAADAGIDLLLGTVEPAADGTEAGALWRAQHHLVDGHTAIHAANLGVRLSAYDQVGGFDGRDTGEDADLVHRLRDLAGVPWAATDRTRVVTSARRDGRVDGGFARFLRRLDDLVLTHGVTPELEGRMRQTVLDLVARRGPDRSICPSEAARAVDADRVQALTHLARAVACQLADEGLVEITQRGVPVDGRRAPGPVRVRIADPSG